MVAMKLDIAKEITKAAIAEAKKRGMSCAVAVVDDRGVLKTFYRMESAPIATVDIARNKAWTAVAFQVPSSDIAKFGNPDSINLGFNIQNDNDRLTTIAGGLPINKNGAVIGGIGISGGTPEEDSAIAKLAIQNI